MEDAYFTSLITDDRSLPDDVGDFSRELGLDVMPDFKRSFELASRPGFSLANQNVAIGGPRIIFARARLSGREGFYGLIKWLKVEEPHRKKGYGRRILNDLEEEAGKRRLNMIFAPTTTYECSELYGHCGYTQVGEGVKIPGSFRADGFQHEKRMYMKTLG